MIGNMQEVDTFIRLSQRKLIVDKIADKNLRNAVLSRNALIETARIKKAWVLAQWREEDTKKQKETEDARPVPTTTHHNEQRDLQEEQEEQEEEELDRGAIRSHATHAAPVTAAAPSSVSASASSGSISVLSLKRSFSSCAYDASINNNDENNTELHNRKRPHTTAATITTTHSLDTALACSC